MMQDPGRWWQCGCGRINSWTARQCAACSRLSGTHMTEAQKRAKVGTVGGKVIRPIASSKEVR